MFKNHLKELVRSVDGALGAVIMGLDGISVEEYSERADMDLQVIGIEMASVVKDISHVSISMETGEVGEILMVTDQRSLLVRKINEEYFVTLVMNGLGNLGKGRFKLKILVPKLFKEFV